MTHIPHLKNYPQAYFNWIYGIANKDAWKEWAQKEEVRELPKYEKKEIKWSETFISTFSKEVKTLINP